MEGRRDSLREREKEIDYNDRSKEGLGRIHLSCLREGTTWIFFLFLCAKEWNWKKKSRQFLELRDKYIHTSVVLVVTSLPSLVPISCLKLINKRKEWERGVKNENSLVFLPPPLLNLFFGSAFLTFLFYRNAPILVLFWRFSCPRRSSPFSLFCDGITSITWAINKEKRQNSQWSNVS